MAGTLFALALRRGARDPRGIVRASPRVVRHFGWFRQATSYCETLAVLRAFCCAEPA